VGLWVVLPVSPIFFHLLMDKIELMDSWACGFLGFILGWGYIWGYIWGYTKRKVGVTLLTNFIARVLGVRYRKMAFLMCFWLELYPIIH